MIWAPKSASSMAPNGAGPMPANSTIRRLDSGPPPAASCSAIGLDPCEGDAEERFAEILRCGAAGLSPFQRPVEHADQGIAQRHQICSILQPTRSRRAGDQPFPVLFVGGPD